LSKVLLPRMVISFVRSLPGSGGLTAWLSDNKERRRFSQLVRRISVGWSEDAVRCPL
jgi:hypothetical protein